MERREFVRRSFAAGAALAAGPFARAASGAAPGATSGTAPAKHPFKLRYAPHFGMFEHSAGPDLLDQLRFMADAGFTALEDNGMMQRPVEVQERIGSELARLGMTMGVFVIDGGDNWKTSLTTGRQEFVDTFVATCRAAVDVARRVNATWMTVVPGYFDRTKPMGYQTANVVEALRRGAEILEPHGLVMVMEPLSDNADLFLRTSDQSYMIAKAVDSPACKILFDIYHMQRNEGHIIPHLDMAWDEVAYIQIGDNPGRNEPTTGEINYKNVFRHIHAKGFTGILGMEHGNARPGREGEQALIDAYVEVDGFDA